MVGFIVRLDHEGLTGIVRWLALAPSHYDALLHFFHTSAWKLETLLSHWATWAVNTCPVIRFNGRPLLIGDGTIVTKEALKMPGVKKLHQDSHDNAKKEYVFGHHVGFVGLLIGSLKKAVCLPLAGAVHDGVNGVLSEKGLNDAEPTLVTRMANALVRAAKQTGQCCYATADAYYAVGPMFLILKAHLHESGRQWVHLITRAKDNYVAYNRQEGQPDYDKEQKIHLMEMFDHPLLFTPISLMIKGELKTVAVFTADLLWKPVDGLIRFVWIKDGDERFILMGSDLTLDAETMITVYHYRPCIETMFMALKHWIGAFGYHFWCQVCPRRANKPEYQKLPEKEKNKLADTVNAIEKFVNLGAMALGILQYLALTATDEIWNSEHGWFRTYSTAIPSERLVQNVVKNEFYHTLDKVPNCRTLQMLKAKQLKTQQTPVSLKE